MKRFDFWQRWLLVLSVVIAVFGLLLAFISGTKLFAIFDTQVNPVFWETVDIPGQAATFQRWIYAVLGATLSGWGITLAFIAHYPFKRKEKWAWQCVTAGLLVWFLVDTALSLYFRVYFNVAFNTALFVLSILPVLATRKEF